MFSVAHCCIFTVCNHCLTYPSHFAHSLQEAGELCNAILKAPFVYRVLYYQWFQTSGGLGTSPTDKEELLFLDQ